MIFSIAETKRRRDKFLWVGELFEEKVCFWELDKLSSPNGNQIRSDANFKKSKFSASRFSIIADYLLDNDFTNIYFTSNEEQDIEMLFSGRTDMIFASEHSIKINVDKLNFDFSKIKRVMNKPIIPNPTSIAFNIDSDIAMVKHFQQAFLEIERNGTLAKIKQKWHVHTYNQSCY